jgi:uncharacterized LabA/DUF88 family protein
MGAALIVVDTPNITRSVIQRYGSSMRADYTRLKEWGTELSGGGVVAEALVNGGVPRSFASHLRALGYSVIFSNAVDVDDRLVSRAVLRHDYFQHVVIGSGDGGYAPLIKLLRRAGRSVTVAAVPGSIARALYSVADCISDFPLLRNAN